jgi:hypothetical protein
MQGYKVKEKTAIVPHYTPSFKTQWAPCIPLQKINYNYVIVADGWSIPILSFVLWDTFFSNNDKLSRDQLKQTLGQFEKLFDYKFEI